MIDIKNVTKGDQVIIKKGTPIRSTGSVRNKVAGKDYLVTVHHTLIGKYITAHTALHDRNFRNDLDKYGIDKAALLKLYDENPNAFFQDCNIELTAPSVVWVGAGGYWHEASVNDIDTLIKQIAA